MKNRRGREDVARKETEEDIITRIAWLYYKEKMTQQEIAERIFLSRQKVQRLLEKARDLEIIQFTLRHPYMNLMSIESEIRKKFGLKDAVVAPMASEDSSRLRPGFAMAGAAYLERKLGAMKKCLLGIGWRNTTAYRRGRRSVEGERHPRCSSQEVHQRADHGRKHRAGADARLTGPEHPWKGNPVNGGCSMD